MFDQEDEGTIAEDVLAGFVRDGDQEPEKPIVGQVGKIMAIS